MALIGILGTGVMGPQIAAAMALAGHEVRLYNHKDPAPALPRLKQWLKIGMRKDPSVVHDLDRLLASVQLTTDLEALREASLVIESVVEQLAVKQDLFARLN